MSSFAYRVFDPANYTSSRPTYPSLLYKVILNYHTGIRGTIDVSQLPPTALDLGCGTGQVTRVLAQLGFSTVIGADPSPKMIDQANSELSQNSVAEGGVRYVVVQAEEADTIASPGSVGLVTAGVAAHWFELEKLWPALSKVLAPGGTVAFWGYTQFRLKDHPELSSTIKYYLDSSEQLGPYWEQPGRSIVDNHMQAIHFPTSSEWDETSIRRIYFCGAHIAGLDLPYIELRGGNEGEPTSLHNPKWTEFKTDAILRKTHTWESMKAYMRTWSALQIYYDKHPEEKENRCLGKDGDIVERFVGALKERVGGDEVTLEWPLTLLMIKKKTAQGQ